MTTSINQKSKKDYFHAQVAGMNLKLRSSYDEDMIYELVHYVNKKFKEARSSMKSGSFQMAAILTALNIAEEYLLLKKQHLSDLNCVETKAQRILTVLESAQKEGIFKKEPHHKDLVSE